MECVMNHNRIFKSKIFYSVFIFVCTILFFSCENFLDSGDVKEAIDKAIYIANSECPVATLEEPIFQNEGVEKNKAIVISFTLPVDPDTFINSLQIVDSANENLLPNFMPPLWSSDYKTVTIAANEKNLIDLGDDKTKDIFVKLSRKCTTKDELPITQAINHKYRINDTVDNVPPVIENVKATHPSDAPEAMNEDGDSAALIEGEITDANEEQIITANHLNTKFDLYVEGSDYGGGRVWGLLRYHRLYDAVGNTVNDEEETQLINFEEHTADDKWYGTTTLDFSDNSKYLDGLYEIKVYVKDSYGLECETPKIFNIIRDTTLAYSLNGRMNLLSFQFRNLDEIPTKEEFEFKTIQKLEWNDPARKLPATTYNGQTIETQPYNGPDDRSWYVINSTVATAKVIEKWKKWIDFSGIFDDVYYFSQRTGKSYSNNFRDFTYHLSWGVKDDMQDPVKLEIDENYEHVDWYPDRVYGLPEECIKYCSKHKAEDIYFTTTYVDTVGNKNSLTLLYPREVEFHNYKVEADELNSTPDNPRKKVTINFADMSKQNITNMLNLPDKKVRVLYRVFYGKYEEGQDVSEIELTRNASRPWLYDPNGSYSDSNVIYNLEPEKDYVIYLQCYYETDSLLKSQYTGGLPGPLHYATINTSRSNGEVLSKPEFTEPTRVSAGQNTALFNVTATITNFQNGVSYIPAYSIDDGQNWIYYEAQTLTEKHEFTISVPNPLRMPIKAGEAWANDVWDYTFRTSNWTGVSTDGEGHKSGGWEDDNTYFIAVQNCRNQCDGGYPEVKAKLKLLAVSDDEIKESDIQDIIFYEDDDNIPPYVRDDITLHDSKLSFDGHSFMFNELIKEDEGHINEYFDFYYVPYQEMWGNNLNVLTEDEIANLPGGVSSFDSSCWLDDNGNADYHLNMAIPTFGLEDGKYMYYAKLSDTYGNYKYVTLGQAHIGTFKNKLSVELEYDEIEKQYHFISKLPLEPDEDFDRYMISVQKLNYDNKSNTYVWQAAFDWSNELQDCRKIIENGKTVLVNISGVDGIFGGWLKNGGYGAIKTPSLYEYSYYRLTVQAFNNNSYSDGKGVDKEYGRPYCDVNVDNIWDHDIMGYIENESEYDVCTDETVSNTVVMFVPPSRQEHSDWYDEPVQSSFFVDTSTPRSNKDYAVQIIASGRDLGDDIDEWERRGKIVKTYQYNTHIYSSGKFIVNPDYDSHEPETTDNPKYIFNENYPGYDDYVENPEYNTFDASVAQEDMFNSREKGLVYYVVVAYFADNSRAMSKVYSMQGF